MAHHETGNAMRWIARVAVRVPRDGGDDIASDATRRLQRPQGIEAIEIVDLHGIEPALAATVAQFEIRAVTATPYDEEGTRRLLASASGIERVDRIEPVR